VTTDELAALAENVVKSTAARILDEHRQSEAARNEATTAVAKELIALRNERELLKQALNATLDRLGRLERRFGKSTQPPDLGPRVVKSDPFLEVLEKITVRA
jgi:hypothetical protein